MARVVGTNGDDKLFVDGDNSTALGRFGNDTITAGDGLDIFINGGPGFDRLEFAFPDSAERGGATVDFRDGTVTRGSGDTRLTADLVSISSVRGTDFADTFTGNSQDNFVLAGTGDDLLVGGAGNDSFLSGSDTDNDTLVGGFGDDSLTLGQVFRRGDVLGGNDLAIGGAGDDFFTMQGGLLNRVHGQEGADTFFWNITRGRAVIADFEDGIDKVELRFGVTAQETLNRAEQVGDRVVINLAGLPEVGPGNHLLVFQNLNLVNLTKADFI